MGLNDRDYYQDAVQNKQTRQAGRTAHSQPLFVDDFQRLLQNNRPRRGWLYKIAALVAALLLTTAFLYFLEKQFNIFWFSRAYMKLKLYWLLL